MPLVRYTPIIADFANKAKLSLLCFLLMTLLILSFGQTVKALDASEELNRLMEEQEALEAQWEEAQNALNYFEDEQFLADSDLAWLKERSEEQKNLYSEHMLQIAAITDLQRSLDRNLEIAIRRYEQKKATYEARMDSMIRMQKKSQLEILLESESLTSYYTTMRLMKLISDADEQDLEHLRQAKADLQQQYDETSERLTQLEELLAVIEGDMNAIQADLEDYESNMAYMDNEMEVLYNQIQEYSNDHFQLQLNIDEAARRQEQEAYIASLEQQVVDNPAAAAASPIYSGNGFVWPLANFDEISSEYGERYIPEAGIADFHTGLDLAADFDTPCLASAPGTVVFAGWYNEYAGNTVRIDVGSGIVIMYCHLNSVAVAYGQNVNAGDVVAYVGSTGSSTGPHLHFQVEVGGNHVDPRLYLY